MIPEHVRERIERLGRETVEILPYDSRWLGLFLEERGRLVALFPALVRRVEHFGSTAVPGLSAKPIVDMLVEVTSLDEVKAQIVPVLESAGYDFLWRPTAGDGYAAVLRVVHQAQQRGAADASHSHGGV